MLKLFPGGQQSGVETVHSFLDLVIIVSLLGVVQPVWILKPVATNSSNWRNLKFANISHHQLLVIPDKLRL